MYLRSTKGQQRLSNVTLINIDREYVNFVVNTDINRFIDIFCRRNGGDSYFF